MNEKQLELQIKIFAEQAIAQVRTLSGDVKNLTAQAKSFANDSKEVAQTFQQWQKEANSASGSFGQLKSAVTQTAAAVALIKTVDKVKDLTSFALAQADAFQTARNEFGILLGDMEAGAGLFNEIKAFNDKTPFALDTTKQAVNVLLSADVPLTQINERLRQFGDLSQGNSQRFSSYIDAFSKASAKGKVDMQVLNTYLNQGVPILKELAIGFNVTQEEIVDMVSKGQIGFRDFTAALDRLTAEGGKYFGGMELGSKSLAAMQEGLKESVNSLAASYGQALLPITTKALEIFTNLVNAINDSPLVKGILAGAVVFLTGYLAAMAVKQAALAVKTWLAYAAQMGFNASLAVTNPLMIAGIVAATAATVAVVAYASARQKATEESHNGALAAKKEADAIQNAANAAREYAAALYDMGAAAQSNFLRATEAQLAHAEREIGQLQMLLGKTPKKIEVEEKVGGWTDIFIVDNPVYEKLQQALDSAKFKAYQLKTNIIEVKKTMGDIAVSSVKAFGTEWADKLKTGLQALEAEKIKAIEALNKKANEIFKGDFKNNAAYVSELEALREYYRRKRADLEKKDIIEFNTAWQDKMKSGIALIENEKKKSIDELNKHASKALSENYDEHVSYIAELGALNLHYDERKRDFERETIMRAHELRMENYRKEWEYQKKLARENNDIMKFAGALIMENIAGTQIGQAIAGGNPVTMFIESLVKAVLELENVNKVLNFIGTIVEGIMSVIGPLINGAFADVVNLLLEIGVAIGNVLAPVIGVLSSTLKALVGINKILIIPLNALGNAFEWLYNNVIYPFGNAIIKMINAIFDALNVLPFVNLKKIEYLSAIGTLAQEIAEEMERRKEEITKMYERQKDRVRDELSAQISSIRQQYELGLLNRAEYEKQAEKYQSAADFKLIDINNEMLKKLEAIENNTNAVLTPEQKKTLEKIVNVTIPSIPSVTVPDLIIKPDIGKDSNSYGSDNFLDGIAKFFKNLFKFESGTPFVPFDMTAVIHQGEGIIPRTFNDGIRSGEYALVGRSGKNSSGNAASITVNINVAGSVTTERDLSAVVYKTIAAGIESGDFCPLPA